MVVTTSLPDRTQRAGAEATQLAEAEETQRVGAEATRRVEVEDRIGAEEIRRVGVEDRTGAEEGIGEEEVQVGERIGELVEEEEWVVAMLEADQCREILVTIPLNQQIIKLLEKGIRHSLNLRRESTMMTSRLCLSNPVLMIHSCRQLPLPLPLPLPLSLIPLIY